MSYPGSMKMIYKIINMKKFIKIFAFVLLLGLSNTTFAEGEINLSIRSGDNIVFEGSIPFPEEGNAILNDENGIPHEVNARSVLNLISVADSLSDNFNITNLTYFDSFNSLYLKCINHTSLECDNWQYVVNNSYPGIGMDQKILSGGESIYLYFGTPNRIILNSSNINTNDTLIVTTEDYDYENNSWITRTGVTVGVTTPDPNNPWSPIEVITNIVNENGQATFSNIPEGTYNVGVKEDFYFPVEPLTVNASSSGGGGSSGGNTGSNNKKTTLIEEKEIIYTFNNKKAYEFIFSKQKEDGSFGEDIYTDWGTISIKKDPVHGSEKIKLIKYLSQTPPQGDLLTDKERRAMALMSLGLNPYSTNGINYIQEIINDFDGKQFGDKELDNDDIFALIVLQNAGFTYEDIEIQKSIEFILSKQKENGSWDESIDMTGASISALVAFKDKSGINDALTKARAFLEDMQKIDGGFGNVSSTAWAVEGIKSLGEEVDDWDKNNKNPFDYMAQEQGEDGGIRNEIENNKLWETAYTLLAFEEQNWNDLLEDFDKQELQKKKVVKEKVAIKKVEENTLESISKNIDLEKIASENTASAINIVDDNEKSWLGKLISKIFGSN